MISKTISWLEKNSSVTWLIVTFIAVTIFSFSSLSVQPSTEESLLVLPIIYHFTIFFFLAFFLFIASVKGKYKRVFILVIIMSLLYAGLDELHQSFIPFRDASLFDVYTDAAGIAIAFLLYYISIRYRTLTSAIYLKK